MLDNIPDFIRRSMACLLVTLTDFGLSSIVRGRLIKSLSMVRDGTLNEDDKTKDCPP